MAEVKMNSVSKLFGDVKAVNQFQSVIHDGEFVSILGPSGCGKTTMLRMIAGFERPSDGEIIIGDQVVSSAAANTFVPPEKRNIGMVFQSYAVWPHMNVFDNVAYPLRIQKLAKDVIREKTERALELVHLQGYAERFPNQLSGGQQQRVALARALVGEPKLLLLDEPLSNLDAKLRESMRFEIKELQRKLRITVIYVTHDQAEAMAMSDRIIVMHQGVIQQNDKPTFVYENPVNEVVADFIGLVNFIPADVTIGKVYFATINHTIDHATDYVGKAVIMVRPEHIRLGKEGMGLKGTMLHKFYLGDSTDCRIRIGEQIIRVIEKGTSCLQYADGEDVDLEFTKILIFPRK